MAGAMKGMDRLKLNLNRIDQAVSGPGLKRALDAAGFVAEGIAKSIVVDKDIIDTGFLLNSIQADDPILSRTGGSVDVGVAAEYAKHHEYGTSKMAARPFMRPTLTEGRAQIQSAFSNQLDSEIDNAIR